LARSITATDDKATPGAGHNSKKALTREEHAALLNHHINKLREQQAAVALARAPFDAAQQAMTSLFNGAKADLGKNYSRKYLTGLTEDVGARIRNIAQTEEQRFQDRVALAIEAKDELTWQADGFLAGRRVDERKAPEGCPPRMDQFWLKGYDLGQAEAAAQFSKGKVLAEARAKPPAPPEEPKPDVDPEKAIKDAAKKLKDTGFTDRAPANQVAA
jgi:hypothetical protein